MNNMINNLGNRMVLLARVCNIGRREWSQDERRFIETKPQTKLDHEFNGMVMAVKAMEIEYDFEYDTECVEMTAIILMGKRFEI